ncbi:MAG: RecX family transcriptional regulator [Clostridiales bacterium]|nr:RecX family transcriptional regulator [Clostridiales bacterium]
MAEITGITPQKKDKTRCNIEVDGRFYCGMKLETVMQNRLKVGSVVSPEELAAIQLESEKTPALDKALTHITASMKTEREIRDYLRRKGYLQDVCDYVVEKMKDYGFLNDEEYAKAFAENAKKREGKRMIALKLKRKGVSDEDIECTLENLTGEEESAKNVLNKYMRGKTADRETLSKAYRHLLSKGYDYEIAKSALRALGAEDED